MSAPDFFPELLAPAGNLEKLRTAFFYGADAVYLGGEAGESSLNLRAGCEGFGARELAEGLRTAKEHGGRVYYCLNSMPMEQDMRHLPPVIEETASLGVDGFIIADPGVLRLARKYAPSVPVHLSTQANTTNGEAVRFWAERGVSRVNLARELSFKEIEAVRQACPDVELEVFVHGAMCLAVSGQCLLSAWLNGRPANAGRCTQPCRFEYRPVTGMEEGGAGFEQPLDAGGEGGSGLEAMRGIPCTYTVEERTRPGEPLWSVNREGAFTNIWAPDDLCLLPWLPWFIRMGITALKIEGRMKGPGYVAHVVDVYGSALRTLRNAQRQGGDASRPAGHAGEGVLREGRFAPQAAGQEVILSSERDREVPETFAGWETYMPDLLYTASRPLGSGFFLPGGRRNLTEEFLSARGFSAGEAEASPFAFTAQPLLAKITEPADGAGGSRGWRMEVRGAWRDGMAAEIMLPGMERPVLQPGSYALENHRGERVSSVGSGIRGVLHTDSPHVRPGCFVRAARTESKN